MREQAEGGHRAPSTVVVGLSGGVDSSVAAWLLKKQGFNVIAVTLALAEPGDQETSRSCCSPGLMARAKAIADHLGIPHYAVDRRDAFSRLVVDYFVSEYESGRTPNPCAKCNARLRFAALLEAAGSLGAGLVATGHYARLRGEAQRLSRARDALKDQSYVLAEVDPQLLERCVFPLGELRKSEVLDIAAEAGLASLISEESQDICFIPGSRYRAFLADRLGERPGDVVDEQGKVIGRHTGTYNYTIGQRRGLSAGGGPPLYVARVDAERQQIVAGREGEDATSAIRFKISAVHKNQARGAVRVQFRSLGRPVGGRLHDGSMVVLDEPARGVAPGQTIVIYDGDEVILGGVIIGTS